MRKPLLATKRVTFQHTIRKGTVSTSYTTVLTNVSCHETYGAQVESPGFVPSHNTEICIFPQHSQIGPCEGAEAAMDADSTFLAPEAFRASDEATRACHWTLAPEDKVTLPSGRTGTVLRVQDNRSGHCPHWYVEVR